MRSEPVVDALQMARWQRSPDGTIVLADRGVQGGFNWSSHRLEVVEVFDGGDSGLEQEDQRCSRSARRQWQFWRLIVTGITSAEATLRVGVSVPVGTQWFRHAGGMPRLSLLDPSGRYLSSEEREEIALLSAQQIGVREIARRIGRNPGTISRELRRNAATGGGKPECRALVAQWKAKQAAKCPKVARLVTDDRFRDYVQQRLVGHVRKPDDSIVTGPKPPPWKRLNKPHRQNRQWATA